MKLIKLKGENIIPTDAGLLKNQVSIILMMHAVLGNEEIPKIFVMKPDKITLNFHLFDLSQVKKKFGDKRVNSLLEKIIEKTLLPNLYFLSDGHHRAFSYEVIKKGIEAIEIESVDDIREVIKQVQLPYQRTYPFNLPGYFYADNPFKHAGEVFGRGILQRTMCKLEEEKGKQYDLSKFPVNLKELIIEIKEKCRPSFNTPQADEDIVLRYLKKYE